MKNSVSLKQLPKVLDLAGAQIRVEAVDDKQYRAAVTRSYPAGERLLVGEVPTETMYIYIPG